MTNHSAAPAAPHSADALKQQSRAEFEAHIRAKAESEEYATLILQRNGLDEYSTVWVQAEWNGWQAAWNRRPTPASDLCADLNAERINTTPASPSLDNEAAARLRKQAEEAKKVRGVVALSPEDAFALLDRVERAEANNCDTNVRDIDTLAERLKITTLVGDRIRLDHIQAGIILAALDAKRAEAAAGAVPEGYALVPKVPTEDMVIAGFESRPDPVFSPEHWEEYENASGCQQAAMRAKFCWAAMIAAAPPAQGLPAAPLDQYMQASIALDAATDNFYGRAPAAAPSEPVAKPILYARQMDLDAAAKFGKSVLAAPTSEEEWTVPLFATTPAQDAGTASIKEKEPK